MAEWGRWEGTDRDRQPVEVDIVAPLVGGGVLAGEVEWNREPIGIGVHTGHLDKLCRMAEAGRAWAHQTLGPNGALLYVSVSGFTDGFRERAEGDGHRVVCWSLEDLYADEAGAT